MIHQTYLSYELDDLDKDVEGRIPGHHTSGAFGEKCWNNAEQSTTGKKGGNLASIFSAEQQRPWFKELSTW